MGGGKEEKKSSSEATERKTGCGQQNLLGAEGVLEKICLEKYRNIDLDVKNQIIEHDSEDPLPCTASFSPSKNQYHSPPSSSTFSTASFSPSKVKNQYENK